MRVLVMYTSAVLKLAVETKAHVLSFEHNVAGRRSRLWRENDRLASLVDDTGATQLVGIGISNGDGINSRFIY